MSDLLKTAQRDYIRMSESAICRLQIAHRMMGTPPILRGGAGGQSPEMAFEMGKAMEPVINQYMARQGLTLGFVDSDQLRVALDDPYRMGHADGIAWLTQASDLSQWAQRNLPSDLIMRLIDGELFLWEVKTMNGNTWGQFARGGIMSNVFLSHYSDQVNSYLYALNNPATDELWMDNEIVVDPATGKEKQIGWGATAFRAQLKEIGRDRPHAAIICGLNTDTKRYAFEVRELDIKQAIATSNRLSLVTEYMHQGTMPPPDYDGKASDCWFCAYAHLCPSVAQLQAEFSIDDLSTNTVDTMIIKELDGLSEVYTEIGDQIKGLTSERKALKERIEDIVETVAPRIRTDNFRIAYSNVGGRRTVDMDALEIIASIFGFEIPDKTGKGSKRLRIDTLYGPSHDNGDKDES